MSESSSSTAELGATVELPHLSQRNPCKCHKREPVNYLRFPAINANSRHFQ